MRKVSVRLPSLVTCAIWISYCIASASDQMDVVARDRPQILNVIDRQGAIWNWLENRFINTNGVPAIWSGEAPILPSHYLSAHRFTSNGQAVIMVLGKRPDGTLIGGEEVLSMLVFELLNASHRDQFFQLDSFAHEKLISRQEYIYRMAEIEHGVALELKQFRINMWIPNAAEKKIPWDNAFWKQGTNENFDIYLRTVRQMHIGYPDDVFGPRYDFLVGENKYFHESTINPSNLEFKGIQAYKFGKINEAIDDYSSALNGDPENTTIYFNRGLAKRSKGDLNGAMEDFTAAIHLDPKNSDAYLNRAFVETCRRETPSAINDFKTAANLASEYKSVCAFSVWVALINESRKIEADQEIRNFLKNDSPHLDEWDTILGKFLLGQEDEQNLLLCASSFASAETKERVASAWYYIAIKRFCSNQKSSALQAAEECLEQADSNSTEHFLICQFLLIDLGVNMKDFPH